MSSNPLDSATTVNATASPLSLNDSLNSTNPNKIYCFRLTSRSSLNVSLSGLSADANVQLIQDRNHNGTIDAGDVLASSTQSGTIAESIKQSLEPGTYFLRIYAASPGLSTNYHLNVFAPQAAQYGSTAVDYGGDGKLKTFEIASDNNVWVWQESDNNFTYWHKMGLLAKTLQVIQGGDGKLDVFGIGLDDKAWEWKESDNNFTAWHDLGFKAKSLQAIADSNGKVDVFGIGLDDKAWEWKESDNNFTYWHDLGFKAKSLQAVQEGNSKLAAFGIGFDNKAWEWREGDNNFTYWHDLGFTAKSLQIIQSGDGKLNAFGISLDDKAWEWREGDNNFTYWHDLGFKAKSLQAVQGGDGRTDVFGISLDNKAWEWREGDNNFTYWHDLGFTAKSLQIIQSGDGKLNAFGISLDDKAWEWREGDNNFTYWHDLGFKAKSLQAVKGGDGKLDVVAAGLDGDTWQWRESDNNFTYWHKMGLAPKSLQPVFGSDGKLNVFAISSDNNVWQWRESDNNFTYWHQMGLIAKDALLAIGYDGNGVNTTYINTFDRISGAAFAGHVTDNVHRLSSGYVQDFSGGSEGSGSIMKSDANNNSYWVGGDFWNKFVEVGGAGGIFGYPTSDRYAVNGGIRQNFQGGVIYKTSRGLFTVSGSIGNYYFNTTDGDRGRLGLPVSSKMSLSNGITRQNFEKGYILWNGTATGYNSDGSLLFPPKPTPIAQNPIDSKSGNTNLPISWDSTPYFDELSDRDSYFYKNGRPSSLKQAYSFNEFKRFKDNYESDEGNWKNIYKGKDNLRMEDYGKYNWLQSSYQDFKQFEYTQANGWQAMGWNNAHDLLTYYLDNKGGEKAIDVDELLRESSVAAARTDFNGNKSKLIDEAKNLVENLHYKKGKIVIGFQGSGDLANLADVGTLLNSGKGNDVNWQLAMGNFDFSFSADFEWIADNNDKNSRSGKIKVTTTLTIADVYNFELPYYKEQMLHNVGLAQNFYIHGEKKTEDYIPFTFA